MSRDQRRTKCSKHSCVKMLRKPQLCSIDFKSNDKKKRKSGFLFSLRNYLKVAPRLGIELKTFCLLNIRAFILVIRNLQNIVYNNRGFCD